jgi:hypothetical protein
MIIALVSLGRADFKQCYFIYEFAGRVKLRRLHNMTSEIKTLFIRFSKQLRMSFVHIKAAPLITESRNRADRSHSPATTVASLVEL